VLTFFVALVLFSGTSLFATAAAYIDHGLIDKALAASGKASHDPRGHSVSFRSHGSSDSRGDRTRG
jgi:hypothetical protein